MMRITPLVLSALVSAFTGSALAGENKRVLPDNVKVSVSHRNFFDSRTGDPNILHSRFRVSVGNTSVDVSDYLRRFSLPNRRVDAVGKFIISVSASLSIAPTALEGTTLETLEEKVDAALSEKEPYIRGQVTQGVDYGLSQNPVVGGAPFNELPPEVREGIRKQLIEQTLSETMADLKEKALETNNERVAQIKTETSIQEIAVVMAYNLNQNAVLFVRAGKYKMEKATGQDANGYTELERRRLSRSPVQGMTTAGPTTGVTLGSIYRREDYTVQAELAIFHDRMPFLNTNDYIGDVVLLSEEDFDRHRDLGDINSGRIRVNVKSRLVDIYITAGEYDGKTAYATGAVIRLTEKFSLHTDYAKSNRPYTAEQGISVFVSYDTRVFNKNLSLYVGQEDLDNNPIPGSDQREDVQNRIGGAQLVVWQGKFYGMVGRFTLNAEYYQKKSGSETDDGVKAGGQLELLY